jgi:hypothetical protein
MENGELCPRGQHTLGSQFNPTKFGPNRFFVALWLKRIGQKSPFSGEPILRMFLKNQVSTYVPSIYLRTKYLPTYQVSTYVPSIYLRTKYLPTYQVSTYVPSIYLRTKYLPTYQVSSYVPSIYLRMYLHMYFTFLQIFLVCLLLVRAQSGSARPGPGIVKRIIVCM